MAETDEQHNSNAQTRKMDDSNNISSCLIYGSPVTADEGAHDKGAERPITEKEIEETLAATVQAPDGGWGWMVVFSSFIIHIIVDGITYSFGVLFVELLEDFQGRKGDTAWILSIFVGMTLGTGPIASALVNLYGCRIVTVLGAVIGAIGVVISPFAPQMWFLYLSFGFISGLGFGFIYLPAIVIVSYYFEKRRALAIGLACCGSGLGTFIFPPLITLLLDEYGWKQSCFWLAGIILQCCIFGAFFRPLPVIDNTEQVNEQKSHPSVQLSGKSYSESHVLRDSSRHKARSGSSDKGGTPSRSGLSLNQIASINSLNKQELQGHQLKDHITLHRKDVFYSGSLRNIPLYNQNPTAYAASNMSLDNSLHLVKDPNHKPVSQSGGGGVCDTLCNSMKQLIDVSLLKDWAFVLFLFSNLFTNFGFNAPFLYIPDRAKSYGINKADAAYLLSFVGAANTVGRVLFGFLADLSFIKRHRLHVYNTGLVIAGLSTCFSYTPTYGGQVVYAVFYGVFIGCYVSLTAIVLVDLLGVDKLSSSFGVTLLVQGVSVLVGPPACGWIYDSTHTYLWPFVVMGGCIAFSGFILYFLPLLSRLQYGGSRAKTDIDMGVRIAVDTIKEEAKEEVVLTAVRTDGMTSSDE